MTPPLSVVLALLLPIACALAKSPPRLPSRFDESMQASLREALQMVAANNCSCEALEGDRPGQFYPRCVEDRPSDGPSVACVPRILHQTWNTKEVPELLQSYRKTWSDLNPSWLLILWTEDDRREWLQTNFAWFMPTYKAYAQPVQRADAIRYFVLHSYGGVYADMDVECLRPLDTFVDRMSRPLGFIAPGNWWSSISNGIMISRYCPAEWAGLLRLLVSSAVTANRGFWAVFPSHRIMSSTGPTFLRYWLEQTRPASVCRLHRESFSPCDYCDTTCAPTGDSVYTLHHYSRSWNRWDSWIVNNLSCHLTLTNAVLVVFLIIFLWGGSRLHTAWKSRSLRRLFTRQQVPWRIRESSDV